MPDLSSLPDDELLDAFGESAAFGDDAETERLQSEASRRLSVRVARIAELERKLSFSEKTLAEVVSLSHEKIEAAEKERDEAYLRENGWMQVGAGDWSGAWRPPGAEWPKIRALTDALAKQFALDGVGGAT